MVVRLTVSSTENDDVNVSSTDCVCVLVHEYDAVAVTVLENEYVNVDDRSFVSDSVRDTEIVSVAVSVISVLSEGVTVRAVLVIVGRPSPFDVDNVGESVGVFVAGLAEQHTDRIAVTIMVKATQLIFMRKYRLPPPKFLHEE
jgi:hypothetical protein